MKSHRLPPPLPSRPRFVLWIALAGGALLLFVILGVALLWKQGGGKGLFLVDRRETAQQVFLDYTDDLENGQRRYKGKNLELTGWADQAQGQDGSRYVQFIITRRSGGVEGAGDTWRRMAEAAAAPVQGIRCYLASGQDLGKSSRVRVRGRCTGWSEQTRQVELAGCEVVVVPEN